MLIKLNVSSKAIEHIVNKYVVLQIKTNKQKNNVYN